MYSCLATLSSSMRRYSSNEMRCRAGYTIALIVAQTCSLGCGARRITLDRQTMVGPEHFELTPARNGARFDEVEREIRRLKPATGPCRITITDAPRDVVTLSHGSSAISLDLDEGCRRQKGDTVLMRLVRVVIELAGAAGPHSRASPSL